MNEIEYQNQIPNDFEYNFLRKIVGWGEFDKDVIDKALHNSLFCVCAYHKNTIIGMARVIGDNGLVFYVQDVIVLPEFQGEGVGTKLMQKVMEFIQNNANKYSVIGLMSASGKEKFYEKFGFITRPNNELGAGMTIFWQL